MFRSGTTRSFSDPQMSHLQPASPKLPEHPAEHVGALGAQDEVVMEVVRQAASCYTIVVDTADNELSHALVDDGRELDTQRLHHALGIPQRKRQTGLPAQ